MTDSIPTSYGTIVGDHLARIEKHNAEAIDRAASAILTTVRADGTVYTAGAGHSLAAVAETFYRAGGLALIRPLYHPDLLPMHGARSSTTAERRSGLAEEVLGKVDITGEDTLVVFSHSGINPYPVELAAAGRAAGCPVIAVTSTAAGAAAPRRSHSTVAEQADVILDTLVPPGDAAYPASRRSRQRCPRSPPASCGTSCWCGCTTAPRPNSPVGAARTSSAAIRPMRRCSTASCPGSPSWADSRPRPAPSALALTTAHERRGASARRGRRDQPAGCDRSYRSCAATMSCARNATQSSIPCSGTVSSSPSGVSA